MFQYRIIHYNFRKKNMFLACIQPFFNIVVSIAEVFYFSDHCTQIVGNTFDKNEVGIEICANHSKVIYNTVQNQH